MREVTLNKTKLYCDEEDRKSFKKFLIENDLTLTKAAHKLDMTTAYLSAILLGKRELTYKIQRRIKEVFGYEM